LLQIVIHRKRRQRIRLAARIEGGWPLLTRHPHALFGFLIKRVEIVVRERPIIADAVQRLYPKVFRRVARRHAAPVHRQPADMHAW